MDERGYRSHVLAIPYPSQGHVNPMLQLCKRLASQKLIKPTLAVTNFISTTYKPKPTAHVNFDTISDGYDEGGFAHAKSIHDYLNHLEASGRKTLSELIKKYKEIGDPIGFVIYDGFLPWALDVAKEFGLGGAPLFTQSCNVNIIYYYIYHGLLKLPVPSSPVSIDGMPLLELKDMPSFVHDLGSYPAYFDLVLNQFSNFEKADWILVNTVYEFEAQVVDAMSKLCPILTVGPTVPSFYLDKSIEDDNDYGLNLLKVDSSSTEWLTTKPKQSVIYVSFGSMASLSDKQMEEIALGLKESNYYFLWVIRPSEEPKIPKWLSQGKKTDKWVIVEWSNQLEVLSDDSIGCFFTHCGWNSTLEALCLGVPMVGMPQWTDQTTNAKFIEDVWKVGVRVKSDGDGFVGKEEVKCCIEQVMVGEKAQCVRENAMKWREVVMGAIRHGGSTDLNIEKFITKL